MKVSDTSPAENFFDDTAGEINQVEEKTISLFSISIKNFLGNHLAVLATAIVIFAIILSIFSPYFAPHDPNKTNLFLRLQAPAWMEGGNWSHPLGADHLGRDILSRIIYGTRVSIIVGFSVIFIATAIGILLGLMAGYLKGKFDLVISTIVDILLGFPYLIFAIALMAAMGPGFQNIILALVYKEWVIPCRVVRGETLAVKEIEYVEAAQAIGASKFHIMLKEILPNILSPVIVVATTRMATVIILESSLSFLGLGVQPPMASWGNMVADGREFMLEAWWVSTFSGIAILILVLSMNIASLGLRDAFDPRFSES
ncbi:MAG: ABC transporter permease [Desulfobacula sp.]|uniref:ABC transporter permease n=1 Tax=Desulfobacula sp. TaxID=2593537 RepID=UPI0025BC49EB|nr:ABC transporter permease [Desulfobacula sp.]MCD4720432.1 ABC transporter permease [Desulfobacula sp.]